MAITALAVLFWSLFISFYDLNVQSTAKTCDYKGRNYMECDLVFWTGWNTCTGGHGPKPTECAVGLEKRHCYFCCPRHALNETTNETVLLCKRKCNMTDDDFQELRRIIGAPRVVGNGTVKDTSVDAGLSIEEIAGIAAAGGAVLLFLCCLVFGLLYKRQKRKRRSNPRKKVMTSAHPNKRSNFAKKK